MSDKYGIVNIIEWLSQKELDKLAVKAGYINFLHYINAAEKDE